MSTNDVASFFVEHTAVVLGLALSVLVILLLGFIVTDRRTLRLLRIEHFHLALCIHHHNSIANGE